jgi:hypothetical protein
MSRPTFDELVALEPRLADLLAEAQAVRRQKGRRLNVNQTFFAYGNFAAGFKGRLSRLVGHASGREGVLGTSAAYDTVYWTVYHTLSGQDAKAREWAAGT